MKYLHEVERPAAWGDWVCSCQGCRINMEKSGQTYPDLTFVVKFSVGPRKTIRWYEYLMHMNLYGSLDSYSDHPNDTVREVFVKQGTGGPGDHR